MNDTGNSQYLLVVTNAREILAITYQQKIHFFEMLPIPVAFLRSRYNQGFSDGRDSQSRLNYDRDQSKYDQGFIDGMKAKVRDAMNL